MNARTSPRATLVRSSDGYHVLLDKRRVGYVRRVRRDRKDWIVQGRGLAGRSGTFRSRSEAVAALTAYVAAREAVIK